LLKTSIGVRVRVYFEKINHHGY